LGGVGVIRRKLARRVVNNKAGAPLGFNPGSDSHPHQIHGC
jgi:hypothetical protein